MSFQKDLEATSGLEAAYCSGLQALQEADRNKLTVRSPRNLRGSADIDAALSDRYPHENRWDYVIACATGSNGERLHWIEVHPACGNNSISEVAAKARWLSRWLDGEGIALKREGQEFVWIASGAVGFRAGSQQTKKIANSGVTFKGNHYHLDS